MCSLHRFFHATDVSITFDDETDAHLDAHTPETDPPNLEFLFAYRSLRCRIMERSPWKTYMDAAIATGHLQVQTLQISSFATSSPISVTTAPCTKSTTSETDSIIPPYGGQKVEKSQGPCGVFAGLLQDVLEECLTALPPRYNAALETGRVRMLRKNSVLCMQVISSGLLKARMLRKVFAYLLPGRIEHIPDTLDHGKQHGFRPTVKLHFEKTTTHGIPTWLVRFFGGLDLLEAFDCMHELSLCNGQIT